MAETIAIVGSGMIGSGLARLAASAGYDVVISNTRGPESLAELVAEIGNGARAASVADAIAQTDLIIAAVPMGAYDKLPANLLQGKTVIDTLNYYPMRDGEMPDVSAAKITTSELLQQHLEGAKVVKALHNLDFYHLVANARPAGHPERTTLPLAGNDPEANAKVADFMRAIGYDACDIGPLSESWRIEPGTKIYVWPYVPQIPTDASPEEARRIYLEVTPAPLSMAQVAEMAKNATRSNPVGGFTHDLPDIHINMVGEVYQGRAVQSQ
jgi:predicted dinucleotide-binding enzyme